MGCITRASLIYRSYIGHTLNGLHHSRARERIQEVRSGSVRRESPQNATLVFTILRERHGTDAIERAYPPRSFPADESVGAIGGFFGEA